jgi:hypothetical protein
MLAEAKREAERIVKEARERQTQLTRSRRSPSRPSAPAEDIIEDARAREREIRSAPRTTPTRSSTRSRSTSRSSSPRSSAGRERLQGRTSRPKSLASAATRAMPVDAGGPCTSLSASPCGCGGRSRRRPARRRRLAGSARRAATSRRCARTLPDNASGAQRARAADAELLLQRAAGCTRSTWPSASTSSTATPTASSRRADRAPGYPPILVGENLPGRAEQSTPATSRAVDESPGHRATARAATRDRLGSPSRRPRS